MTIIEYKQKFLELHAKFEEEHGSIDGDINPDVNVKPTRK